MNNNLDRQYTDLLKDILENGVQKTDRTGTGTISVFGRQIRHKMSEGFPLLTTKKMYFKGIVTELLWFLRGDTNIKYLLDNDCHIWDGDAYKNYLTKVNNGRIYPNSFTQEEFINKIKTDDEFAKKWGDLGPIYGRMWRSWLKLRWEATDKTDPSYPDKPMIKWNIGQIDQIQNLINDLKTNPDSRRLMVNAWNVGELDQMVLPPCHYGFQVYTRELSFDERAKLANRPEMIKDKNYTDNAISELTELLNENNIPTRAISLMWNQRSVDTPLGLPFNIASYGLLLEIIAKEVNMVPDELIGNLGDCHIYLNQIDGVKEQIGRELTPTERMNISKDYGNTHNVQANWDVAEELITHMCDKWNVPKRTREPFPLPKLVMSNQLNFNEGVDEFLKSALITDFIIEGYQSHPTIKFPLSN